jgi:hypothetical protein
MREAALRTSEDTIHAILNYIQCAMAKTRSNGGRKEELSLCVRADVNEK